MNTAVSAKTKQRQLFCWTKISFHFLLNRFQRLFSFFSVSEKSAASSVGSRGRNQRLAGLNVRRDLRTSAADYFRHQPFPKFASEPSSPLFWPTALEPGRSAGVRPILSPQPSYLLQPKPVLLSNENMQVIKTS